MSCLDLLWELPPEMAERVTQNFQSIDWLRFEAQLYVKYPQLLAWAPGLHGTQPCKSQLPHAGVWIKCASRWAFPMPDYTRRKGRRRGPRYSPRGVLLCKRSGKLCIRSGRGARASSVKLGFRQLPVAYRDAVHSNRRIWVTLPPYQHPREPGCREWIRARGAHIWNEINLRHPHKAVLVFLTQGGIASVYGPSRKRNPRARTSRTVPYCISNE